MTYLAENGEQFGYVHSSTDLPCSKSPAAENANAEKKTPNQTNNNTHKPIHETHSISRLEFVHFDNLHAHSHVCTTLYRTQTHSVGRLAGRISSLRHAKIYSHAFLNTRPSLKCHVEQHLHAYA